MTFAGRTAPNEHPEKAVLRELLEETGIYFNADIYLNLTEIVSIKDSRGGNWLDIIYSVSTNSSIINKRNSIAEFREVWLDANKACKLLGSVLFNKIIQITKII